MTLENPTEHLATIRRQLQALAAEGELTLDAFAQAPRLTPLTIGVIGIFSTGKSTFLNVLLGRRILPVAIGPKTAVPVFIESSAGLEEAELEYKDGHRELRGLDAAVSEGALPRGSDVHDVDDFATNLKLKSITLRLRLPEVFTDVQIIDTPGLNSPYEEHERLANQVLRECDVVLYLLDEVIKAADTSALLIGRSHVSRFIFIQTKVDRARPESSWDETMGANAAQIAAIVDYPVTILPVSAALTQADTGSDEPGKWGMPRVRDALAAAIADRYRLRTLSDAMKLSTAVTDAILRVSAHEAALAGGDPELRASIELREQQLRLASLAEPKLDPLLAMAFRSVDAFASAHVAGWREELRTAMLAQRIGNDPQEQVRAAALTRIRMILDRDAEDEVRRSVTLADAAARDLLYDTFGIDVTGPLRGHPSLEVDCPPVPRGLVRRFFDWFSGTPKVNESEVEQIAATVSSALAKQLGLAARISLNDAFAKYLGYVKAAIPTIEAERDALKSQLEDSRPDRARRVEHTRKVGLGLEQLRADIRGVIEQLHACVATTQ